MSASHGGDLMTLAEKWIREVYYSRGRFSTTVPLTPDTDLISSAILDSVGFLELLAYVETLAGTKADLGDANLGSLTTIRSICSPPALSREEPDV